MNMRLILLVLLVLLLSNCSNNTSYRCEWRLIHICKYNKIVERRDCNDTNRRGDIEEASK
jgi:hypothetical protein